MYFSFVYSAIFVEDKFIVIIWLFLLLLVSICPMVITLSDFLDRKINVLSFG